MDIVLLARRCAKNSEERLKRDDQLNAAFANRFGEKINEHDLDLKEHVKLASGENEQRKHTLN